MPLAPSLALESVGHRFEGAEHLFRGLGPAGLGHEVSWSGNQLGFGRGQIIWRDANGVLCGGTEPRSDGCVAAW